jgi:hypothetical protein
MAAKPYLLACVWLALLLSAPAQAPQEIPAKSKPEVVAPVPTTTEGNAQQRTQLNLLGQTDAASGESRRNENVQFNLMPRFAHQFSAGVAQPIHDCHRQCASRLSQLGGEWLPRRQLAREQPAANQLRLRQDISLYAAAEFLTDWSKMAEEVIR